MSETPDERRERIDAARRDQAELNREIGQEFSGLAVRPSAVEAWRRLQADLQAGAHKDVPILPRCEGKADRYQDYDAYNVPSPARAAMMCRGCPFEKVCNDYAEVEKPGWGVYGGKVYGRALAEKERREDKKRQKEEQ